MTHRVINFSPGPATVPLPALERAQRDLVDYDGTGISIAEHSHRGKAYAAVHAEAKALIVELLAVPDTHEVLFMQGGASGQFAFVPMNLLGAGQSADYVITGTWSQKAIKEAKILGSAREAANPAKDGKWTRVPSQGELDLDGNAAYVHLTTNNTIAGTQFFDFPDTGAVPLIADMSSDIAWRPTDVSRFGLIYAGAQKNLGIAGVTVVIIHKDLIEKGRTDIPSIFRYATLAKGDSLQNTAPTFPIYMTRNVLAWVKDQGGLTAMEKRNREKGETLYGAMAKAPDFYRCPVDESCRSVMNAVFRLPNEDLEQRFIAEAAKQDMVGLKGHRSVGGIRVSMYNAMEPSSIDKLASFMGDFHKSA